MEKVLLQFRHKGAAPTASEAAAMFDLSEKEVDAEFGVIATDPEHGLYTILIDETAVPRAQTRLDERGGASDEGIFANPRIEPTDSVE